MACLGAIRPSDKGNTLHILNTASCEKILTINDVLTKDGNSDASKIK